MSSIFHQNLKIGPYFRSILLNFRFLLPFIFTMMHLRIMRYTYWTPLEPTTVIRSASQRNPVQNLFLLKRSIDP